MNVEFYRFFSILIEIILFFLMYSINVLPNLLIIWLNLHPRERVVILQKSSMGTYYRLSNLLVERWGGRSGLESKFPSCPTGTVPDPWVKWPVTPIVQGPGCLSQGPSPGPSIPWTCSWKPCPCSRSRLIVSSPQMLFSVCCWYCLVLPLICF